VLAMPVLLRDQIIAIALYGLHRSGADIDPDEERSLKPLLERAGAAYDHIDAEALRAKVELLTRERESKQREIERLRAEAKALRASPEHG
jgi:vacuolar-type H+-ATPase subunit E/Vma4